MAKQPSPGNLFFSDLGEQPVSTLSAENAAQPEPSSRDSLSWQPPSQEKKIYQVSELNQSVGQALARGFAQVWLEGEVSNLSRPHSGHLYFSLKDDLAQVRCALFRQTALRTDAKALQMGAKVLVRAKVGLYEPRGDYQLIIQSVEEAGVGELQRTYELLLKKLQAEGLFSGERKLALPKSIRHVGIITSQTGAAVHDVISTIQRRNPSISIYLYPSMVQGDQAAASIREALALAISHRKVDALLLVRGGGSLEDLHSFNDEALARAIAECPIPTISGVGHEVDVTICDWVADLRAPTPTGAAELVAEDSSTQRATLTRLNHDLYQRQRQRLEKTRQNLAHLSTRLSVSHPEQKLEQHSQKLDELTARLYKTTSRELKNNDRHLQQISQRLMHLSPQKWLPMERSRLSNASRQLSTATQQRLYQYQQSASALAAQLHTVSPLQTLARGYSIVQDQNERVINQTSQINTGDSIRIRLSDGNLSATINAVQKKPKA